MQISNNTKETFKALAKSSYGKFLEEHFEALLTELGNVETLKPDPVDSRKEAISIIKRNVVDLLELKETKTVQPDDYR